jgi:pantoate--beta-alanine ligase
MTIDTTSYELPVARNVADLRALVSRWRKVGETIALVPTMGALHRGHLALVEQAREKADRVVVSIFVNPAQFAPHEDFGDYPRTERGDIEKLKPLGVDLVYGPAASQMYDADFSTGIDTGEIASGLCAATRPHFFGGVAIVVAKLLLQCLPDMAIFGEKDYQQLLVIKRMVRDLSIPVEILSGATERESDGLAISSRNVYLSEDERTKAVQLSVVLKEVAAAVETGGEIEAALKAGITKLRQAGFEPVDYLELRDAQTLEPVTQITRDARVLGAAHLGQTRLIDNLAVKAPR